MTKDAGDLTQFHAVACRECTLPREDGSSQPRGWIQGNTKIGPVLEVTTSYLQGKYGVEIRIESVNQDKSHSWVGISHGLSKLVTDLIDKEYDDNEQETSETKTEEFALKTNGLAFASRPKAKVKPRRSTSACSSARTVPICERRWTDIEPGTQSNLAYPVAKRLNPLLRHGQFPREEDGAIEFWRLRDYLSTYNIGLMMYGRARWQEAEATTKDFNIVLTRQDKKFFISELSHRSYTPGQCVNSGQFLRVFLSHWMCNQFTLHHKFRIDSGRTNFKQGKTDGILYGCEPHGQGSQRSVQA